MGILNAEGVITIPPNDFGRPVAQWEETSDVNGVVIFYREKRNPEGMHLLY